MRETFANRLWIGHAGDLRTESCPSGLGLDAIIHIAIEDPVPSLQPRAYVPPLSLSDGANRVQLISAALETTAFMIIGEVPTLVTCRGGHEHITIDRGGRHCPCDRLGPEDLS